MANRTYVEVPQPSEAAVDVKLRTMMPNSKFFGRVEENVCITLQWVVA